MPIPKLAKVLRLYLLDWLDLERRIPISPTKPVSADIGVSEDGPTGYVYLNSDQAYKDFIIKTGKGINVSRLV